MLDKTHRSRKRLSIKGRGAPHVIGVGSRVSVRDHETGELEVYTLVLPTDADISRHLVSTFTPLGLAIVGRKAGDIVEYSAPGGLVKIRIESAQLAPLTEVSGQAS